MVWARSRKPHRSPRGTASTDGIDLLGFAFNVPTRHDLRRHREIQEEEAQVTESTSDESDDRDESEDTDSDGLGTDDEELKTRVLYIPARYISSEHCSSSRKASAHHCDSPSPRKSPRKHQKQASKELQRSHSEAESTAGQPKTKRKKGKKIKKALEHAQQSPIPACAQTGTSLPAAPTSTISVEPVEVASRSDQPSPESAEQHTMPFPPPFMAFQPPSVHGPPVPQAHTAIPYHTPVSHMYPAQPQPMYFAQPGFTHSQFATPSPLAMPGPTSGSSLEDIQRLQNEIDALEKSQLRSRKQAHAADLKQLHDKLNATLDAATLRPGTSERPSQGVEQSQSMEAHMPPQLGTEYVSSTKRNGTAVENNAHVTDGAAAHKTTSTNGSETSARNVQHHLCSNCGNIRSLRFHQKHPWRPGQKAVINYCESCRVSRIERGGTEQYHFCFGCGRGRSKVYQVAHPIAAGRPLPPNYCGKCVVEAKRDAAIMGLPMHDGESLVTRSRVTSSPSVEKKPVDHHFDGCNLSQHSEQDQPRRDSPETRSRPCHRREMAERRVDWHAGMADSSTDSLDDTAGLSSKYRRPYVEDSSTVAPKLERGEAHEDHRHSSVPSRSTSRFESHRGKPRRSSIKSQSSSSSSYASKTVSFESDLDFDTRKHPRSAKETFPRHGSRSKDRTKSSQGGSGRTGQDPSQPESPKLRSPMNDRSRLSRDLFEGVGRSPKSSSGLRGVPRMRSAFAGMPFDQCNQFGPHASREARPDIDLPPPSPDDDIHAFEPAKSDRGPHFNSSPGAFSQGGRDDRSRHKEYRGSSSYSTSTSAYTAFTPASPNPYYTPQTSPSFFDGGMPRKMGFRKARSMKKAQSMFYNPIPITEEMEMLPDGEGLDSPVLRINCAPYSDETDTISSPEYALSSTDSSSQSEGYRSRRISLTEIPEKIPNTEDP